MIRNMIFYLCYFYFLLIIKTSKAKLIGRELVENEALQGKQIVYCCPHNFLLGLFAGTEIAELKRASVALVASLSADGELIAKLLKKLRYEMVRGSSNRGGKKAMFDLIQAAKEGKSLGIAFDGPKGPPLVPKRGLMGCARVTKGSIYFIYGYGKACRFLPFLKPFRVNSWDKFLIPVPFCSLDVYFEKVPEYQSKNNSEHFEKEREDFILDYIEKRSKEVFGYLYC